MGAAFPRPRCMPFGSALPRPVAGCDWDPQPPALISFASLDSVFLGYASVTGLRSFARAGTDCDIHIGRHRLADYVSYWLDSYFWLERRRLP